jgi:uncharacterized membrane protein
MNSVRLLRYTGLLGYLGICILMPLWYLYLAPPTLPIWLAITFFMVPLVFPLKGMLSGKRYTYAWSSFLSMAYFAHGVGEAWTLPDERLYGIIEIILSLMWFTGSILYVRKSKRQQ